VEPPGAGTSPRNHVSTFPVDEILICISQIQYETITNARKGQGDRE